MRVRLNVAQQYRSTALVERGEEVPEQLMLEVPLSELSPAARAALADLPVGSDHGGQYRWTGAYQDYSPVPQSPQEWETLLLGWAAAITARKAADKAAQEQELADRRERATKVAQQYIAGDRNLRCYAEADGTYYGSLSSTDVRLLPEELQQAVLTEASQRRALRTSLEAEREAAEAATKAARRQERADWIAQHGSEHLRAAIGAGYNCQRLYITERAALEHPGYTVDFDDNAESKSRSCPSPEALAEELRVTPSLREGESIAVVWLIHGTEAADEDEDGDCERYEAREAVVIEDWLGKYTLIRTEFAEV